MTPKRRKNLNRKAARNKRDLTWERLFGAGILCFTIGADGYALAQVFQHWRTYGDVFFDPDITTILTILTVSAILGLLLFRFDRQAPHQ